MTRNDNGQFYAINIYFFSLANASVFAFLIVLTFIATISSIDIESTQTIDSTSGASRSVQVEPTSKTVPIDSNTGVSVNGSSVAPSSDLLNLLSRLFQDDDDHEWRDD